MTSASEECLVRWSDGRPGAPQIVGIAHAGAGAAVFREWAAALPDFGVIGARLPGREKRLVEEPHRTIAPAVTELVLAIAALGSETPVALFGQCSGAVIAFETARAMSATATPATHLFVAGQVAPPVLVEEIARDAGKKTVEEQLKEIGGIPQEIWENPELLEIVMPTAEADFQALESYTYVPGPALGAPITAFVGEDDLIDRAAMERWDRETSGAFSLHPLPGGHIPAAAVVCEQIANALR